MTQQSFHQDMAGERAIYACFNGQHTDGNYCGQCGRKNWWLCQNNHIVIVNDRFCRHCGVARKDETTDAS